MTSRIQSAATALLLGLCVLAPSMASGQATGDRGRSPGSTPSVMRSLVIDVLSKGLRSGSRPLLRRALADTVMVNGVATEREGAIDAINAELAALRQSNHHLVLVPSHADPAAAQQTLFALSVAETAAVPHGSGVGAMVPHSGQADKSVRPTEEYALGGPDTLVRTFPTRPQGSNILSMDLPSIPDIVFTLEDRTRNGSFRVTSVSLASSLRGR